MFIDSLFIGKIIPVPDELAEWNKNLKTKSQTEKNGPSSMAISKAMALVCFYCAILFGGSLTIILYSRSVCAANERTMRKIWESQSSFYTKSSSLHSSLSLDSTSSRPTIAYESNNTNPRGGIDQNGFQSNYKTEILAVNYNWTFLEYTTCKCSIEITDSLTDVLTSFSHSIILHNQCSFSS